MSRGHRKLNLSPAHFLHQMKSLTVGRLVRGKDTSHVSVGTVIPLVKALIVTLQGEYTRRYGVQSRRPSHTQNAACLSHKTSNHRGL